MARMNSRMPPATMKSATVTPSRSRIAVPSERKASATAVAVVTE